MFAYEVSINRKFSYIICQNNKLHNDIIYKIKLHISNLYFFSFQSKISC